MEAGLARVHSVVWSMPKKDSIIRAFVWYDLETTGSKVGRDSILEFGAVVTDTELKELGDIQRVLVLTPDMRTRLEDTPVVYEMHVNNGLLAECEASSVSVANLDEQLVEWISVFGFRAHQFLSCGSGVSHFDRWFLKQDLPKFEKWFSYPNLDIGVLRRAFDYFDAGYLQAPVPQSYGPTKAHRALADARAHLEEARWLKAKLVQIGKLPGV